MFTQTLRTIAPITGTAPQEPPNQSSDVTDTFNEPVPTLVEEWISEQTSNADFLKSLEALPDIACRDGLYLYAPDHHPPRILVPPQTREPLIRFTHARMFHLGQAKVPERLLKSYFWYKSCHYRLRVIICNDIIPVYTIPLPVNIFWVIIFSTEKGKIFLFGQVRDSVRIQKWLLYIEVK